MVAERGPRTKKSLAIVCCHAIYEGSDPTCEENWRLQSFQQSAGSKPGEHLTFLQHVQAAIHLWESQVVNAIVFSGGRTNPSCPNLSEAQSYLNALEYTRKHTTSQVLLLEEYATDSYQNLLFSILTFRKHHGYYPTEIILITHTFKEQRFLNLHAKSIRWPSDSIRVLGINPPFTKHDLESTKTLEERHGYIPFSEDLYGTGPALSKKRQTRRWNPEASIAALSDGLEDSVKHLLRWEGGETGTEVFPLDLPWEHEVTVTEGVWENEVVH